MTPPREPISDEPRRLSGYAIADSLERDPHVSGIVTWVLASDYDALRDELLALRAREAKMREALRREHEWSERLAKRIRNAVYACEELHDVSAFTNLDDDFFNGIAASYQDDYEAALAGSEG